MSDFIVSLIGGRWALVHSGIILDHHATERRAIARAVAIATEAARRGGRHRVIHEKPDKRRLVLWDSAKDAFIAE